jgi:hypothetical protein
MDKVFTLGRTAVSMMVIISWIRSMVLVFIAGQMVVNMKVCGKTESNMEMVNILLLTGRLDEESGKMAKELSGSMKAINNRHQVATVAITEDSLLFLKISSKNE